MNELKHNRYTTDFHFDEKLFNENKIYQRAHTPFFVIFLTER